MPAGVAICTDCFFFEVYARRRAVKSFCRGGIS